MQHWSLTARAVFWLLCGALGRQVLLADVCFEAAGSRFSDGFSQRKRDTNAAQWESLRSVVWTRKRCRITYAGNTKVMQQEPHEEQGKVNWYINRQELIRAVRTGELERAHHMMGKIQGAGPMNRMQKMWGERADREGNRNTKDVTGTESL